MLPIYGYQKTTTPADEKEFDQQWKTICEEMGSTYFPNHPSVESYLVKGENGENVGTVAFVEQNDDYSIVQSFYDFKNANFIPEGSKVVEMGKLSVKKECRADGHLEKIASCILEYIIKNQNTHIVAFMNADLYAVLRRAYRVPIMRVGEEYTLPKCKGYTVYVDCKKMLEGGNEKFKKLVDLLKKKEAISI